MFCVHTFSLGGFVRGGFGKGGFCPGGLCPGVFCPDTWLCTAHGAGGCAGLFWAVLGWSVPLARQD